MRTEATFVAAMIVSVLVGCATAPAGLELARATEPDEIIFDDRAWDPAELPILNMLFVAPIDRDPLTGKWAPRLAESFELLEGARCSESASATACAGPTACR